MPLIQNTNQVIIPSLAFFFLGLTIFLILAYTHPQWGVFPTTSTTTVPPPPNVIKIFGIVSTTYGTSPYQITFTNGITTNRAAVNTKNYSQVGNYSIPLPNMEVYKVMVYWNSTAPYQAGGTKHNCTPSKSPLVLNISDPLTIRYNFSVSC